MKRINKIKAFCFSILSIGIAACLLSACSEDETMPEKSLDAYQSEFLQYVTSEMQKVEDCVETGYNKGNFKGTQTEFETKKEAYRQVLSEALLLLEKTELTIADIVAAKGILATPGKEFTDKVCPGDLRPLHSAILAAEELYGNTAVGTEAGQVSDADRRAFNQVITSERSLRNAGGTTEYHVPGAIARLEAATRAFQSAIVK